MGKKSEAPAAPDMSAVAAASKESADMSFQLGQDQLAWAKEQFASNKATTDQVVASALETQAQQNQNAADDRKRYEDVFQPQEDKLVADANSYSTDARKDSEIGKSQALVGQQFDAARQNATQSLESYGVNPASTRFGALDIGTRAAEAAAKAAAGTAAIDKTDAIARDLRAQAINIGNKLPAQSTAEYQSGSGAGTGAVNNDLATTGSGANTMGTSTQYTGLGNSALGQEANTANAGYQNQLAQYKADQAASSGVGTALGAIGGLTLGAANLGTGGGVSLGAKMLGFEGGGAVPTDATGGGAVPVHASPSGGKAVDDVPARLNVGEFVIPKDVAAWKGQEHFQKLIEASRKASAEVTAKPAIRQAIPAAPTFQSRPQLGAIPMDRAA
jgi:hypothetical protein